MLSKNISQVEVARIVGCTASAVSQVATKYASQIQNSCALATASGDVMEDAMDRIESQLLEKIERTLPLETDLMKITRMFQVVNGAKRRSKGEGLNGGNFTIDNRKVVQLNLPAHMMKQVQYTTNEQNQVVEINGRNLSIASTKAIEVMAGITEPEELEHVQLESQQSDDTALQGDRIGQDSGALSQETSISPSQVGTSEAASLSLADFE